jgi:hypothetical protein
VAVKGACSASPSHLRPFSCFRGGKMGARKSVATPGSSSRGKLGGSRCAVRRIAELQVRLLVFCFGGDLPYYTYETLVLASTGL